MATVKTIETDEPAGAFIAQLPDEQLASDCRMIVKMMREITGEKPVMWGTSIIGFGKHHYAYASGRTGVICLMGFSPRKQNIALYLPGGPEQLEPELQKIGKYKTGKSCIYIKKLSELDIPSLQKLFKKSYAIGRKNSAGEEGS